MCGPSERSLTLKVGLDSVSKPHALALMSWSCANCACAPVRTKVIRSRPNRSKGSSKAMVSLSGVCRSGGIALAILCLVAKSRARSGCSSSFLDNNRFELRRPQAGLHNPRSDLCLRFFQRLHDRAHGRFLVAGFAIPGHHGHVPVDLRVRLDHLFSLVHALVTRVCTDIGLISTELLAGVETEAWCCHRDSCPRPHRGRRIRDTSACAQRLFHRWVREVEPLLATVDAQYGGDCEWRAATCGTGQWTPGTRACRAIKASSSAQGTTRFISSKNLRLRLHFVLRSNPLSLRLMCFMPAMSLIRQVMPRFCRPSLGK
jgi:hypothetical protein